MTVSVRLNGHRFLLPDDEVPVFEAEVLSAVAAGGAFVAVGGADGGWRVLVTPATTVLVEPYVESVVDDSGEAEFPDLSYLDFDFDE